MSLSKKIITLFFVVASSSGFSQSDKLKALEAKRAQFAKEIKELNALLFSDRKKQKSVVTQVENYNYKISVLQNLIKVTNDQANQLTYEINANQNEISSLRTQLEELKEDYAAMIVKSYKSKSDQSKIMFLLSSENFKQAYKRLQYINQYKDYQQEQAEAIKTKTKKLQDLNITLLKQKEQKEALIEENRKTKRELESEMKIQESLMAEIRQSMNQHTAELRKKRQEADRIDKEINRLIREAIAASNKKAGKTNSTGKFVLTPEAKRLASSFEANKGKLGWPVTRGVIKGKFGKRRSLTDASVTNNYKSIQIATETNADVKAVFKGEVSEILIVKNGNPAVLIRHGNYLTIYMNLSKVYVKKGDKIETGQTIGQVFTNRLRGETLLGFRINKNNQVLNPEYWLAKN